VYAGDVNYDSYCVGSKVAPCTAKIEYKLWGKTYKTNSLRLEFTLLDTLRFVGVDAISLSGSEINSKNVVSDKMGRIMITPDPLFDGVDNFRFQVSDLNYFMIYQDIPTKFKRQGHVSLHFTSINHKPQTYINSTTSSVTLVPNKPSFIRY
jgi:hypothetical protein